MTVAILVGDPERVASSIQALITSGKVIQKICKCKANASYLIVYV
jgi:hypothetical protein